MCALSQGPNGPLLYAREHGLWQAPNAHQEQTRLSLALTPPFPLVCPIQMMGDHLELREIR